MEILDHTTVNFHNIIKFLTYLSAVTLASISIVTPASAAVWCNGKITKVYTAREGGFLILPSFRSDWVQICSVQTEWKGILPQTCNAWVSTVISGMLTGKEFTITYAELDDCSQVQYYQNSPSPTYVMLHQ
ncbi:hypothetical protein [Sphingomonas sp. DT-204]|uniref:hypothetical protein n=1 Tax=Sphingomonas sp. DT-204 TaxID=3396166 RepID=UPI003F1BF917